MSILARLDVAEKEQPGLSEVRRIRDLPIQRPLTPEEVEAVSFAELSKAFISGEHPLCAGKPYRLRPQQAEINTACVEAKGVFAPLRVSAGKMLGSWLCVKAYWRMGCDRILFLVPSDLYEKSVLRDVPFARHAINMDAPVHRLGVPGARRVALARSKYRGVYLYPYSLMSRESAEEELGLLAPEAVVADEAHALRNVKSSAIGKRFRTMMESTKAHFSGFSGTIARRSLLDYWHLIMFALRDGCPLPRIAGEVELWASAVDEVGVVWKEEESVENQDALEILRAWALENVRNGKIPVKDVGGPLTPDAQGYRRAFKLRRNTAPGVVASSEDDVASSLRIVNRPVSVPLSTFEQVSEFEAKLEDRFTGEEMFIPREAFKDMAPYEKVIAFMWAVRRRTTTPNGDRITEKWHNHKWYTEISGGFYNELIWPTVHDVAEARKVDLTEAMRLLDQSKAHHELVRKRDREIREFLDGDHVSGLDSPMLVHNGCEANDSRLPGKLRKFYWAVVGAEFSERVHRIPRKARICDYKVRAAADWAAGLSKDEGALVWAHNKEIQRWTAEVLEETLGTDRVVRCPAGKRFDRIIQSDAVKGKVVVASIKGHHKGKDLQFMFARNYFVQFPRSANIIEQALGRTHRSGQPEDVVTVTMNLTTHFDHLNLDACLHDASWLQQAEGPQKIIFADWPEKPKLHPTEFLIDRGFRDLLSRDQDAALRAIFGTGKDEAEEI